MRILVTGCAGLIGSALCRWLPSTIDIVGVDDLSGGFLDNVPAHVVFVQANLTNINDQKRIATFFPFDYVFHCAAYAAEGLSPFIRQYNYMNNTVATAFLVSESIRHGVKRFVFTSSMAVYGAQSVPFDETFRPEPVDPYGIAKYACELDLKVAYEQHGLSYCIIRPHNVYGPGQNIWDPYRNVLGIWMLQILEGKPPTIYGDGKQTRAFSYVDDVVPCLWRAAVDPFAHCQTINVGGIHSIELNDALDLVIQVTGAPKNKVHLETRHEVRHAWSTHKKSIEVLGYSESVTLRQGLERMWSWVLKQPPRAQKFWSEYELDTGIYSFWKLKKSDALN